MNSERYYNRRQSVANFMRVMETDAGKMVGVGIYDKLVREIKWVVNFQTMGIQNGIHNQVVNTKL